MLSPKSWLVTRDNKNEEEVHASDLNITPAGDLEFSTRENISSVPSYYYIAAGTWRDVVETTELADAWATID